MKLDKHKFISNVLGAVPGIKSIVSHNSFIVINVHLSALNSAARWLSSHQELRFDSLLDVWGTDFPSKKSRFEVNYMLLSIQMQFRVILRVSVSEIGSVPTLCNLFPSAAWLEREVWDMYGVLFDNHPDLRRILTDYGFDGHPLRKDYPLSGFVEVRYDDGCKSIVYEPLEISQEYRNFQFKSPWRSKV